MRILIDMDDVMEDLLESWVSYLNEKYGTSVDFNSISEWDMTATFPTLTFEQIHEPLETKELWSRVKPKDGAVDTIHRIIDDGDEVFVVTTSHYKTIKVKLEEVLFKYFPFINREQVIVAAKKQMIIGDVLIDDCVHNLLNGNYEKILFDAPHNRQFSAESFGMVRVKNWDEIYTIIQALKAPRGCVGVRSTPKKVRNDLFEGDSGSKYE